MAPEQAEGARVTPACDVYSLALTLYEAWTGTNPVKAAGPAATARRLGRPLPSLASMRRDLPVGLCDVIDDALDIDPALPPGSGAAAGGAACRRVRARRRGRPRRAGHAAQGRAAHDHAPAARRSSASRGAATRPTGRSRARSCREEGRRPPRIPERIGAGLAAGGLVLACILTLGPEPSFSPFVAAGLAAVATAVLPRIGWLLAVIGLCAWLVSPEADRQGTALVLAAAAAPVPFLLPRAGLLWSVPILAPLLGTIALAPAFVGDRRARVDPGAPRRAWPRPASGGSCSARRSPAGRCCSARPTARWPRSTWEGSDLARRSPTRSSRS